jgi:hypothetical protein
MPVTGAVVLWQQWANDPLQQLNLRTMTNQEKIEENAKKGADFFTFLENTSLPMLKQALEQIGFGTSDFEVQLRATKSVLRQIEKCNMRIEILKEIRIGDLPDPHADAESMDLVMKHINLMNACTTLDDLNRVYAFSKHHVPFDLLHYVTTHYQSLLQRFNY